jgi:hypothetical protein
MAHNLYIEKGDVHMMYVGKPPWHGLGTRLDKPATSAEAIKAAGLDWTVRKVPLYAIEGPGVAHVPKYFGVVPEDRWGKPDCPVFELSARTTGPFRTSKPSSSSTPLSGRKSPCTTPLARWAKANTCGSSPSCQG